FFSSRRRHTRFSRDWSSDVCSSDLYGNRIHTRVSTPAVLDELLPQCDLVIGAVLVPGAAAPKLVRRAHLARMRRGAVIVDVAIEVGRASCRGWGAVLGRRSLGCEPG